ncbi:MAG: TetR/AcrR family transcriptional regulator [Anaerolineaceae bacterium]|nr:TetR/AcrR family transcriptional regulator [Anaerolineaceae bacterium]
MSKKDSVDPRVRKTKKWLQEALLSLMLQKQFTKISISEITDQAEVSRPTFYLHYHTKEEVLEDYLDSMYTIFMIDMQPNLDSIIQGKMAVKFFEQIADQAVFLRSLIDSEVSNLVMNKLHKYCYAVIKQSLAQAPYHSIEDSTWDFVIASIAGSVYAMSIRWLQMDMPHTPKEMGELTMRLIRPGIREVLTQSGE